MDIINDHLDKITAIIMLIVSSISIRLLLEFSGQKWITTTAHTATIVLLPILTYVITKVISGNIALSLGMVGALSIVRFRNPVRSPLELSVYFGVITMGIAASVSLMWLLFLLLSVTLAIIALYFINIFFPILFKKNFLSISFSEGNILSTLEVVSPKNISNLDKSTLLTIKRNNGDNVEYTLVSNDIEELKKIFTSIKKDNNIISYQLRK